MMGTRSPQVKRFAADQIYLDYVGRDTRYGSWAQNRQHLFRDEDFAALYGADNGTHLRAFPSGDWHPVPARLRKGQLGRGPRAHGVIGAGKWRGLEREEEPIPKSTRQEFEARLVIPEQAVVDG